MGVKRKFLAILILASLCSIAAAGSMVTDPGICSRVSANNLVFNFASLDSRLSGPGAVTSGSYSGAPSFYAPELVSNGDFSAITLGAEKNSGNLSPGHYYEITAHDDADFTADGAADNNVGTRFIATDTNVTLDAGDKVKEISWDDWSAAFQDADSYVLPVPTGLRMVSDNVTPLYFGQTITSVDGAVYKLSVNSTISSGDVRLYVDGITTNMGWSTGTNDHYIVASGSSIEFRFYRYNSGSTDITYHSISVTQCSLDAENLITNGGFETPGVGGGDVFAGWVEEASDGAIADETIIVHYGSHSTKLTAGASRNTRQYLSGIAVSEGEKYCLSFWQYSDGNSPRFMVYDLSNSQAVTSPSVSASGITASSWQQYHYIFTVPSDCTSIGVYLYCPYLNTGVAYFDDVSIRKILPGAELLSDPDFDDAGAWLAGTGWSVDDGMATHIGASGSLSMFSVLQANTLSFTGLSILSRSSGSVSLSLGGAGAGGNYSLVGIYGATGVPSSPTFGLFGDMDGSIDYVSSKKLTLSTCFTTTRLPGAKRVRTTVTTADSEWAGVVMCLDSQTSPANFVVAIIDHGNSNRVSLYSVASGAWTLEIAFTSVTYGAGYMLQIKRVGDVFSVWYGADANSLAQIGTDQTITGMAGVYHGLFGTGDQSTFGELKVRR